MIEDVFAALQSGRPAGDHHGLVKARARFRHRSGREVDIDIVGDEEVELAVAIVIDERAASVPAFAVSGDAGLLADVGEGAVAVVVIENVFAEVADEQIVVAVIVVVADADTLSPARVRLRPALAVTSVKVPSRLFLNRCEVGSCPFGKSFEA